MRVWIRVLCAWMSLAAIARCAEPAVPAADPLAHPSQVPPGDAPRQLFDAVMLGTVHRDTAAATRAKARLVLEHPESIYARYVVTTFAQPQDYRKLLREQLKEHQQELAKGFAQSLCKAARLGSSWFGPQFMTDDGFVLECALAGYEAPDHELETSCREKLNQSKKQAIRQIAAIAFDGSLSIVQKVSGLHAIEEEPAPLFKKYFASRLSGADRELSEMLHVEAEVLLEDRKFGDALPLVEKLAAREETPQVLYWQAWCLAVLGRTEEAQVAIDSLEQAAPNDPWTACAAEIGKSLQSLDENVAATADLLLAVAEKIAREDTDGFQGTAAYRTKDGRTISVYVAALLGRGVFETVVHENGRVVVAYKAAQGQGRTYCEGEQTIQAFQQNATYPVFSCDLDATAETWNARWNVEMANSADAMSQTRQRIKISSTLLSREGLIKVLRGNLVGSGRFPAAVVRDANGSRLTLLHPRARKPEVARSEICVAPDATLTGVEFGELTCENLRYGPSDAIRLSPPPWPDLPVTSREKMDPASLFRMVAAVFSLFDPQPAAAMSSE